MPDSVKIRVLLADEETLRRDGVAAVLEGTNRFEVISVAADGAAALESILAQRPDVAIVHLNLPKVHGIELVRRVRADSPGTKMIIMSGTTDDDIIREVVRAGADGYLLKNGPARHLLDAIDYVRDGGQYFSPQLQRDGRDRHLLEEPPRPPTNEGAGRGENDEPEAGERSARNRRPRRYSRAGDTGKLRERLRQDASSDLTEHDYEVLSMMADGIRPILDRLDEIDVRVAQMETGAEPVPPDPRGWLDKQLATTLTVQRPGETALAPRHVRELEAKLPELIEEAVTARFQQMAGKLQQEIEETHVRTLETFVRNIQTKLVQRVSALEHDMSRQAEAMGQLRESSQRTEENLSRLISGVDKLAQDLPRRLAAAAAAREASEEILPAEPAPPRNTGNGREGEHGPGVPRRGRRQAWKYVWAGVGALVIMGGLGWTIYQFAGTHKDAAQATETQAADKVKMPAAAADTTTKMQAAQESVDRKDYAMAEEVYKQVLKAEPNNVEALKALASVLYREDKLEESAAILDKLARN